MVAILKLLAFIQTMDPEIAILYTIIALVGVYKGIIKLPVLKKTKSGNPHAGCSNEQNLLRIVDKAVNTVARRIQIEERDTLREQMNAAEVYLMEMKKIMKSAYLTMVKEFRGGQKDGLADLKDVQHYVEILDNMETEVLGKFRRWMKENHFIERSEEEFRIYVDGKIKYIDDFITEILNQRYSSAVFEISREKLYDHNILVPSVAAHELIREFFYKARDISRAKKKLVKELNDTMSTVTEEGV